MEPFEEKKIVQRLVQLKDLKKSSSSSETYRKMLKIGANLCPELKVHLIALLGEYADIFAWSPEDMLGINESIAVHKLRLDPST